MTFKQLSLRSPAFTAIVVFGLSSCSSNRRNERQLTAAENEVYEAVVREVLGTSNPQGQLVFDETLLTGFEPTADMRSCEKSVRERLLSEDHTPPYNSFVDRAYRFVVHGYATSLKADTIEDFAARDCTVGSLSQTFHTDVPRTFIAPNTVHFKDLIVHDGSKPFEDMFPGAEGIISLSRVGFDAKLDQAIVSASFVCGMLCGSQKAYVLEKGRNGWVVVDARLVAVH